jgi:hypothetical protein
VSAPGGTGAPGRPRRRSCRRCGGELERLHRTPADRFVDVLYRVHRYRCCNAACGWEGILHAPKRRPAGRRRLLGTPAWVWLLALLLSLALGALLLGLPGGPPKPQAPPPARRTRRSAREASPRAGAAAARAGAEAHSRA